MQSAGRGRCRSRDTATNYRDDGRKPVYRDSKTRAQNCESGSMRANLVITSLDATPHMDRVIRRIERSYQCGELSPTALFSALNSARRKFRHTSVLGFSLTWRGFMVPMTVALSSRSTEPERR